MAHIVVISNFWPSIEKCGVAVSASNHVDLLLRSGHSVSIVGPSARIFSEPLAVNKYFVFARGGGALYSPAIANRVKIREILHAVSPGLIIVEGWQSSITDAFIDVAFELNIKILLVSHGVSLHPFSLSPFEVIRAFGWIFYKNFSLPKRLKKISVLTCLDRNSNSPRFYDRDLALNMGIKVEELPNSPINFSKIFYPREARSNTIVLVGYFSRIKNQLAAIHLMKYIPDELCLRLVGHQSGDYFHKCKQLVSKLGLENRISFISDSECDVELEIGKAFMLLSTSITEVQPLVILEAMASGTPFVATSVGGVDNLRGGVLASDQQSRVLAISSIFKNVDLWSRLSCEGIEQCENKFSNVRTANIFNGIVQQLLNTVGQNAN